MRNCILILGTRPEAIKLLPLYKAMKNNEFNVKVINTGQHHEMILPLFKLFDIQADYNFSLMSPNQSLSQFASKAMEKIDDVLEKENTDLIIVQGDTTTAMIASLVGYYRKIKIAHVEAGLRTFDKYSPFPEEVNRRIIGLTADYHFVPTFTSKNNLLNEGVKNVWVTGNTVIDSLLYVKSKILQNIPDYKLRFKAILKNNNILITCHRRESFGNDFENICIAIKKIAESYKAYNFIYPVHLNPNIKDKAFQLLSDIDNVKLIDPVNYDEMIFLMMESKIILTDSGGIQEEAPSLNIPLLVLREVTERPEGIEAGCAVLTGTTPNAIIYEFKKLAENEKYYDKMANALNPYGNGKSCSAIAEILLSLKE